MTAIEYALVGVVVILAGALAFLYILFFRERDETNHTLNRLSYLQNENKPDNSKIPVLEKRIQVLEASVSELSGKSKNGQRDLGTKRQNQVNAESDLQEGINSVYSGTQFQSEHATRDNTHDRGPKPVPATQQNGRMWVEKTTEGLKRLQKTDKPSGIFLVEVNKKYQFHLANMDPGNLVNYTMLYKEIIQFPAAYSTVSRMEMEEYPIYEKQSEYFIFSKKGKIKIEQ